MIARWALAGVMLASIIIFVYAFTYGMVVLDQPHTQQATEVWGWTLGLDAVLIAGSLGGILYHADKER
jgi:hypothetical protein